MNTSFEFICCLMVGFGFMGFLSGGYLIYELIRYGNRWLINWFKGKEKAPCRAATLHSARGEFLW